MKLFNCIKRTDKLNTDMSKLESVTKSVCEFESDTSDCILIQELKTKQTMKKIVDDDIKAYDTCSHTNVQKFFQFLIALEKNGFKMNTSLCHSFYIREFAYILEAVLYSYSLNDIDDIANELKALKQKIIIIEEKRASSKALKKDIDDIKAKLGIK